MWIHRLPSEPPLFTPEPEYDEHACGRCYDCSTELAQDDDYEED